MANDSLAHYEELSLVPVETEAFWKTAPFYEMAENICISNDFPDWKVSPIARTLELNFARFVADGISPEQAFERIARGGRCISPK